MFVLINESWQDQLKDEFEKPYFKVLTSFVKAEYKSKKIHPQLKDVFKAFDKCPFDKVKVVIIGQDPYHGPNQANGLCFSVPDGVKHPPSLINIFKERMSDLGIPYPNSGSLLSWAEQGVLLLNSTLTVEESKAGSHQKKGWENFTDAVIKLISDNKEKVVFVLWGSFAQKKGRVIDVNKHKIITSVHPSPLSVYRGFWGSSPFSKVNQHLKEFNLNEVNWCNE